MPRVVVPRGAWPDDRYPHWAVAALRAAGAPVSEDGDRGDVALLPAAANELPRTHARRVIGLVDKPPRVGEKRLAGAETVAVSEALARWWPGARVVRPAVAAGEAVTGEGDTLRLASLGPLHWSTGHEHVIAAAARLLASGTPAALRVVGSGGPARDSILFTALDLGIEDAVTVTDGDEHEEALRADVVVVGAVEDRAWTGLLHALAGGVPVAATDLPTLREYGVPALVPPRDPAALAGAILRRESGPPPATDLEACGMALLR